MIEIPFTKMHGLGNCFVLAEDMSGALGSRGDIHAIARGICDRNFGIGADGLILVGRSATADLGMRIINEDGSEPEMCGNGVRCLARFALEQKITDKRDLAIETGAGLVRTRLLPDDAVAVDMGEPRLETPDVQGADTPPIEVAVGNRTYFFVSMGNPHAVAFVDDFEFDWRAVGAEVERFAAFPNRTNVEFARRVGPSEVHVKVWERGCGETLACGTGACAVVVAGTLSGRFGQEPVTVHLPGGDLSIRIEDSGRVTMTGPAVSVCRGVYWHE